MECPWNEASTFKWKQYLDQQGGSTQQSAELLAQMVARQKQLFSRAQAARHLANCLGVSHPAHKGSLCSECHIPCVVDSVGDALFLPECGHLVHAMCQSQATRCAVCLVQTARVGVPAEDVQDAWLDAKVLFDIAACRTDEARAAKWAENKATFGGQNTDGLPLVQALTRGDDPPTTATVADLKAAYMDQLLVRASAIVDSLSTVVITQSLVCNEAAASSHQPATAWQPASSHQPAPQWQPADAVKVRGNITTQRGTELFVITTRYNGKCGQCKAPTLENVSLICKPKNTEDNRWFCTMCAAGRDQEDVRRELLNPSHKRPAPSAGPPRKKRSSEVASDMDSIIDM